MPFSQMFYTRQVRCCRFLLLSCHFSTSLSSLHFSPDITSILTKSFSALPLHAKDIIDNRDFYTLMIVSLTRSSLTLEVPPSRDASPHFSKYRESQIIDYRQKAPHDARLIIWPRHTNAYTHYLLSNACLKERD